MKTLKLKNKTRSHVHVKSVATKQTNLADSHYQYLMSQNHNWIARQNNNDFVRSIN